MKEPMTYWRAGKAFVLKPDPNSIGARGAVYNWLVELDEQKVFESPNRYGCVCFLDGIEWGKENG